MSSPIRVLVTGVSGGSIGLQVCKALRMGSHHYEIVTTNMNRSALAIFKAEYSEILPRATASHYLDALLALVDKYQVQFLIPGSEPELIMLSRYRHVFRHTDVRMLINADSVIAACVDKRLTFEKLASLGFRVPMTQEISDVKELEGVKSAFPYIVKPAQGGGGSASTFIAQDQVELHFFVNYLLQYGHRALVQEYIGSAENEYTVGVLHTPDQTLIGSVALKRQILTGLSNRLRIANRTGRSELGATLAISSGISQGQINDYPEIRKQAEAIATAINSTGPLNVQGRWDGENFVPFEINPRFSGTTPMRTMAGFNELELLINWYLYPDRTLIYEGTVKSGSFVRGIIESFSPHI